MTESTKLTAQITQLLRGTKTESIFITPPLQIQTSQMWAVGKKHAALLESHAVIKKMTMHFLFIRTFCAKQTGTPSPLPADNPETRKQQHKCKAQWYDKHTVHLSG